MTPSFGFRFAPLSMGAAKGPNDPAAEHFRGAIEESVARETIQNSLDVRAADAEGPVEVVFEVRTMRTDEIPDVDAIRSAIRASAKTHHGSQGVGVLDEAERSLDAPFIQVLRVGDYNTTGLTGSESQEDFKSALSALTRGVGISSTDASRGGSFGIGSIVGPAASSIRTVFYTSMTSESPDVIFAGYCLAASHKDAAGQWRTADGFFTDRSREDDFAYQRNRSPFGGFPPRTEPGTDVYIVGYRHADSDPVLHHLRDAVLRNFLVAIDRGQLVVRGRTDEGSQWVLNQESLEEVLGSSQELRAQVLPYYLALRDPQPLVREDPKWGRLELYIYEDDSLPSPLWTWGMRKPLMKVMQFRTTSISIPFAAVMIASGDLVNEKLRDIEPPRHNDWERGRAPYGNSLVDTLWKFVREGLRARLAVTSERKTVRVKGLARFLPAGTQVGVPQPGSGAIPDANGSSEDESFPQHGQDEVVAPPVITKSTRVTVQRAGRSTPDGEAGATGKDRGGSKPRQGTGAELPTSAEAGDGAARIPAEGLRARAWRVPDGHYRLCVHATRAVAGDLALGPLDEDGHPIADYKLEIASATELPSGRRLAVRANSILAMRFSEGDSMVIDVDFSTHERFRLGVGE